MSEEHKDPFWERQPTNGWDALQTIAWLVFWGFVISLIVLA